jgi:hypothetical protein
MPSYEADSVTVPAGSDRFRRILLGSLTALVVAGPLVAGEDPGHLHSSESLSGIVLNMLWLVVVVAGAVWVAMSGRLMRLGGWTALGLFAIAIVLLVSALVVHCYRQPGRLIASSWGILALIYLVVLWVAPDPDNKSDSAGGILAAIMATAVSLALFGIYQVAANAAHWPSLEMIPDTTAGLPPDAGFVAPLPTSPFLGVCRALFQRADTLAALLLLILPLVVAYGLRNRGFRARGSMAISLILFAALAFSLRDYVGHELLPRWRDGTLTSQRMLEEHSILGVGPGSFNRYSGKLQPLELPEVLEDPSNSYLEIASTAGIPAALLVILVFMAMLGQIRRHQVDESVEVEAKPLILDNVRWEFYLGGVFGLLLGLGLRLADFPGAGDAAAMKQNVAAGAAGRALVWFLAFALFEGVAWRTKMRRNAIIAAIAAVMVFGIVSPATIRPAIMQIVVVLAALAVAGPATLAMPIKSPIRWAPVPALASVAVVYLLFVCDPICRTATGMTEARRAGRLFPEFFIQAEAVSGNPYSKEMQRLDNLLNQQIRAPLSYAIDASPFDIDPPLEWAEWFCTYWKFHPSSNQKLGLDPVHDCESLDPIGTRALISELHLHLTFARLDFAQFHPRPGMQVDPKVDQGKLLEQRAGHLEAAESLIRQIVERDPALETRARFRMAQALISIKDPARRKQGVSEARKVLELDRQALGPRWRLDPEERRMVQGWTLRDIPWWAWFSAT